MTDTSRIFISHTGKDRAWAEWARWHLHRAGYTTELDCVDWPAGVNFVAKMHQNLSRLNPMLVLLSAAYLSPDRYTTDEWTARWAQHRNDPGAKLIPVRVDAVDLNGGIWSPIIVPDVFGLAAGAAVRVLLDAVRQVVDPPALDDAGPPPYPGGPAAAPVADGGPRPPGAPPVVWNLVRRNRAFTGRDGMLNRLHDTLAAGGRVAVQALHGVGGVGKTQLALEYAHRFAGEYELSWWVPSEQPELIGDHLAGLAVAAGLAGANAATPDAVKLLHAHLRGQSRWLLIFDNAEDRDDLTPWLPDGPGHVIITSRSPAWTDVAHPIDVDVFTRAESIALLHTHLPRLTDPDADQVAEALGDLPLALGQAADLLAETHLPVPAYLTELGQHAAGLLRDGRPPTGYPASLGATVEVAAQRLTAGNPAAGQLLTLCAHLGPEPIPGYLFTTRPRLLPDTLAAAAGRPVSFARTVAQLARYGLARITDTGPVLHRLTQAVIRDLDPDPATHHAIVERLLTAASPDDARTPAWWPRWAQLLPHILAADPATTDNLDLRRTANLAVLHLRARGDIRTALPLAEHLHAAWTQRHGSEDVFTLASATTLATIQHDLGYHERAFRLNEDTLERRRRVLGEDHPDTLRSTDNLARSLRSLGRVERARQLNEDTLTRSRRVLGSDHPETLLAANNLALDLRLLGDLEKARLLDEDTLARSRRILGAHHPDTLRSARNLANDLGQLGDAEKARELDEDTLIHSRRLLGADHPDTLRSARSLAIDLRMIGDVQQARELDEDTLARFRRVLGDDHPETLSAASNLAADLDALGRHAEADQLRQQNAQPGTQET